MKMKDNNNKEIDLYKKPERKRLLDVDGSFMTFMTKAGELIVLTLAWMVSLIPVVTVIGATTSLYYALVKNIRRSRGYPLTEYWASFKRVLVNGIIISVITGVWCFALYKLFTSTFAMTDEQRAPLVRVYTVLITLTVGVLVYIPPVLSRFPVSAGACIRLAMVMAFRYIHITAVLIASIAGITALYIYMLPLPTIVFVPGLWWLGASWLIEYVLHKYMPEPTEENKDEWYYEL